MHQQCQLSLYGNEEKSILPGELPNDFIGQTQIVDNATYTLSTNLDYQFSAK